MPQFCTGDTEATLHPIRTVLSLNCYQNPEFLPSRNARAVRSARGRVGTSYRAFRECAGWGSLSTICILIVSHKTRHNFFILICSTRTAHRSKAEKLRISSVHRTCTTNEALSQFRQITFLLISSSCGESGVTNM